MVLSVLSFISDIIIHLRYVLRNLALHIFAFVLCNILVKLLCSMNNLISDLLDFGDFVFDIIKSILDLIFNYLDLLALLTPILMNHII